MTADIQNNVVWQRCGAFLMVVGPGAAAAFYMATAGFYFFNFKSPVFFIFMMFCLYLPYPIMPLVQQKFDKKFDERFSTRWMYFLRVVAMQLCLALAVLGWMFIPQSPCFILFVGALLGAMASVIISSSFQMVAALDPHLVVYAQLGQQAGGALPVAVFFALRFDSDSTLYEFRMVLTTVVTVCLLVAALLSHIHFNTELFAKAYSRLSYEEDDDPAGVDGRARLLSTESGPLDAEAAQDGVPSWVWCWIGALGVMTGLGSCVFSLVSFCGCPFLTTLLALCKLAMDVLGRILAMPLDNGFSSKSRPIHFAFIACTVTHMMLGVIILAMFMQLKSRQDFEEHFKLFVFMWCIFNMLRNFASSVVDVTTGLYVRVQDRQSVARTNLMVVTTSGLAGVVVALAVVAAKGDLGGKLPTWDQVIT